MSLWIRIGGAQNEGLYRNTVTKVIKFRKYREGKGEIDRSCKTSSLERARAKRDELMAELWGDNSGKKQLRQTIPEIWAVWFTGMKGTKSKGTADSISAAWNNFKPYVENEFLDGITAEWWTNIYIPQKRAETNKRKAIDNTKRKFFNEWKWMSMFLKWCEENGKGAPDWKRPKLIDPDPEREEGVVYSEEQMKALRENATLRMSAFLVAGEEHFMRRSEIRLLTWDRVDLEKRIITLRAQDTKIRKARKIPFNEKLRDLFLEAKAETEAMGLKTSFVFPSLVSPEINQGMTVGEFRNMWEGCYRKAGLPKGSRFHWLRHTGLTKACRRDGVNHFKLCMVGGLSVEELQDTYLHLTVDDCRGVENLVAAA